MTLLGIGCGWGATMMRAVGATASTSSGLTLSRNQAAHVQPWLLDSSDSPPVQAGAARGLGKFDRPVDRIVSIGAFRAFRLRALHPLLRMASTRCPPTASCTAHHHRASQPDDRTQPAAVPSQFARFAKFIVTEIFPGGRPVDSDGGGACRAASSGVARCNRCSRITPHPRSVGRGGGGGGTGRP